MSMEIVFETMWLDESLRTGKDIEKSRYLKTKTWGILILCGQTVRVPKKQEIIEQFQSKNAENVQVIKRKVSIHKMRYYETQAGRYDEKNHM